MITALSLAIPIAVVFKRLDSNGGFTLSGENSATEVKMNTIRAYFPFTYKEQIDPRSVFSVGDQVLAEHLFAFHARSMLKGGFAPVFSQINFDNQKNQVTIQPKYPIVQNSGETVPMAVLCEGLKSSLEGTRHAPYASIFKEINCNESLNQIVITFTKIPVNLRFLFTVPDLSIFDHRQLPMGMVNRLASSGPYRIESITATRVELKLNPKYPKELRANQVENAELIHYNPSETSQFIQQMNPEQHHSAYFFGHALGDKDIPTLREKGYRVETFPTEWFVYLLIKKQVAKPVKEALIAAIDEFRSNELPKFPLGLPAYSIAPSDREFALNQEEFPKLRIARDPVGQRIAELAFKVSTATTWAEIPVNAKLLEFLKHRFPRMEVELITPSEGMRLFDKNTDISLSLLGISPSDPLSHLSFFESVVYGFGDLVSKEDIAQLATQTESAEFNRRAKELEKRIIRSGLVVPIGHFPGVVAYRNDFIRDDSLAFGWGIQTWSFRLD